MLSYFTVFTFMLYVILEPFKFRTTKSLKESIRNREIPEEQLKESVVYVKFIMLFLSMLFYGIRIIQKIHNFNPKSFACIMLVFALGTIVNILDLKKVKKIHT